MAASQAALDRPRWREADRRDAARPGAEFVTPAVPRPVRFSYDEAARALVIEWDDSAVHRIPFATLRRSCPCARCAGEADLAGRFASDPELRPGEDELADVKLVGAYGVNPIWADGHDTGIHTFANLRQLGEQSAS